MISHAVVQCCYMARDAEIVLNSGKSTCVAALLDSGAVQQVQTPLNPTAVTPMLLAAAFGREECVRLLASHNPAGSAFEIVELSATHCVCFFVVSCSSARLRCKRSDATDDGLGARIVACCRCAAASWCAAIHCRYIRKKVFQV